MNEPEILINGRFLNGAQVTTLRQALEHFDAHLESGGAGKDDNGLMLADAYQSRIEEIRMLINQMPKPLVFHPAYEAERHRVIVASMKVKAQQ